MLHYITSELKYKLKLLKASLHLYYLFTYAV